MWDKIKAVVDMLEIIENAANAPPKQPEPEPATETEEAREERYRGHLTTWYRQSFEDYTQLTRMRKSSWVSE